MDILIENCHIILCIIICHVLLLDLFKHAYRFSVVFCIIRLVPGITVRLCQFFKNPYIIFPSDLFGCFFQKRYLFIFSINAAVQIVNASACHDICTHFCVGILSIIDTVQKNLLRALIIPCIKQDLSFYITDLN